MSVGDIKSRQTLGSDFWFKSGIVVICNQGGKVDWVWSDMEETGSVISLLKPEKGSFMSKGVEKNPPNGTNDPIKLYLIITSQHHQRQWMVHIKCKYTHKVGEIEEYITQIYINALFLLHSNESCVYIYMLNHCVCDSINK